MTLRARSKYVMDAKPAPRAGLTLFCSRDSLACLWTRIVLAEKDVDGARIEWVNPGRPNHDLLVIHPAAVINEYLDERFPHPKLSPPDPAARARLRMALIRLERDLLPLAQRALSDKGAEGKAAKQALGEALLASQRMFPARGWFLGLEYNLADCAWAALFSQLPQLGLKLSGDVQPLIRYAERLLHRPAVRKALTAQ